MIILTLRPSKMSVKGLRRIYQPALNPDIGKATNIKVDIQTKNKDDNIVK